MSTQQRQRTISEAYTWSITPGQRLARYTVSESQRNQPEPLQEDWEDRLRSLEQWICELLIKNQQLRLALVSSTAPEKEKQDRAIENPFYASATSTDLRAFDLRNLLKEGSEQLTQCEQTEEPQTQRRTYYSAHISQSTIG